MKSLIGKTALVTGASKGIGAGIAKELAARGARVVVNYASSREGAEQVVNDILAAGGEATAVQGNIAQEGDIESIFKEARSVYGPINVLVNNAGIFNFRPLEHITAEDITNQFTTNVFGLLLVTQKAVEEFDPQGGSIINIGSTASHMGGPGMAVYAATKGAVEALTRILARELGPKHIRVNAILPGMTETEGAKAAGSMEESVVAAMTERTALHRVGQPQDIGRVVAFLASDDAGWITGELIQASGGLQ